MKLGKRIIIWSILPLSIELMGLLYVDKIYLRRNGNYKIEKVVEKEEKKIDNLEIPMDENINKIQLSHDGKYVSYIKNGNIEIINTLNGEKTSVESSLGELNYYTWLPDRARMYIFEKHIKENGQSYMKLYSYDKDKNHKEEVFR